MKSGKLAVLFVVAVWIAGVAGAAEPCGGQWREVIAAEFATHGSGGLDLLFWDSQMAPADTAQRQRQETLLTGKGHQFQPARRLPEVPDQLVTPVGRAHIYQAGE